MANFSNVVGLGTLLFNSDIGKLRVPLIYLNVPFDSSFSWSINSGNSGTEYSTEFSVLGSHPSGDNTQTHINSVNAVIHLDGGGTITHVATHSYRVSINGITVYSEVGSTRAWNEAAAPFSIAQDSNGKRALFTGSWSGNTTVFPTLLPPSDGRQGYALYSGRLASGVGGFMGAGTVTESAINAITEWLDEYIIEESTDPYLPDGVDPSGTGGGTGTFAETGDTIGIPGLPTLSAVDTGFITLFNPSAAQVKSLANYMWSSSFDLTTFKNIVANPIDCILGLTIVPVDPPNAGSKTVSVGNIPTDVTMPYLSSQYVEVDCGTLNVQEFWGSYLDYSPYTKMSLYLPYIGIIPLDIDDVMNASIEIKYHVDVLSGACVAYVLCNGTQLYTYVGQCSSNVPITSNDFTNTVNGILGIAGALGKLSADGGASAPTAISEVAANAINALKPNIQKSGAMSGTGGLMGVQTPYLICQRPRQSVPAYQNTFTGYPANITAKLSDLSGYTEVESIHLDGLSATQEEQQEIMDLLTSGVII